VVKRCPVPKEMAFDRGEAARAQRGALSLEEPRHERAEREGGLALLLGPLERGVVPERDRPEAALGHPERSIEINLAHVAEIEAPLLMAVSILHHIGALDLLAAGPDPNSEARQCIVPLEMLGLALRRDEDFDGGFGEPHRDAPDFWEATGKQAHASC